MRIRSIGISMLVLAVSLNAQTVYNLPFASKDNTIDLDVENTAATSVSQITVSVQNPPSWLNFRSNAAAIEGLIKGEEKTASFIFSVDKEAPVKKEQKLTFVITGPNNQSWTKEITVSVSPPEKFELFQNYPNPFNPLTTISYQLTTDSKVTLRIYNMLGQEVVTLVDGQKEAGYHQEQWNGRSVASGTYIYRLVTRDEAGKEIAAQNRMVLVK
jgi:Secretion system C-terminal sorting domain